MLQKISALGKAVMVSSTSRVVRGCWAEKIGDSARRQLAYQHVQLKMSECPDDSAWSRDTSCLAGPVGVRPLK